MSWLGVYPPEPSPYSLSKPPEFRPATAVLMPKALAPTKDSINIARATIFGEIFFIFSLISILVVTYLLKNWFLNSRNNGILFQDSFFLCKNSLPQDLCSLGTLGPENSLLNASFIIARLPQETTKHKRYHRHHNQKIPFFLVVVSKIRSD